MAKKHPTDGHRSHAPALTGSGTGESAREAEIGAQEAAKTLPAKVSRWTRDWEAANRVALAERDAIVAERDGLRQVVARVAALADQAINGPGVDVECECEDCRDRYAAAIILDLRAILDGGAS